MTYNKPFNSIEVKTRIGTTVTATDEAKKPIASEALDEFKADKTMHIKGESLVFVPFHAVDVVTVTASMMSVEKGNPYGCEAKGSGNNTACNAKACEAKAGC